MDSDLKIVQIDAITTIELDRPKDLNSLHAAILRAALELCKNEPGTIHGEISTDPGGKVTALIRRKKSKDRDPRLDAQEVEIFQTAIKALGNVVELEPPTIAPIWRAPIPIVEAPPLEEPPLEEPPLEEPPPEDPPADPIVPADAPAEDPPLDEPKP